MGKLKQLNIRAFNGLRVDRYTEHFHKANGEPVNLEIYRVGGNLLQADLKPVLIRHAFEQKSAFSDSGNERAKAIAGAANEAGGLYTEDDVRVYADLMNGIKKGVKFSDVRIPYNPNESDKTDSENYIHEQMENTAFGEIFIPNV
jgi:hypothetical protein